MKIPTCLIFTGGCLAFVLAARADILELKNGVMLNGKYVGGSAGTVRFDTSAGTQVIETGRGLVEADSLVAKIRSLLQKDGLLRP